MEYIIAVDYGAELWAVVRYAVGSAVVWLLIGRAIR